MAKVSRFSSESVSYSPITTQKVSRFGASSANQNNGGFGGGLEYLGAKAGIGAFSILEGIWDYTAGGIADLFGADEWAEKQFANNVAGKWDQQITNKYNPGKGWQFAGDVAGGIGNSLVGVGVAALASLIPGATPAVLAAVSAGTIGLGAAGGSTAQAYQQTGELGAKEYGYGALSGLTETGLEYVSGAAGKVAKGFAKSTAKTVAKKSIVKGMISSGLGEAFEEGMSEILDPYYLRWTQVDPDAKNATAKEIGYAALVGGISGMIMTGVSGSEDSRGIVPNIKSSYDGNRIVTKGQAEGVLGINSEMVDYYEKNDLDSDMFKYAKQLRSEYDKASAKATDGQYNLRQKFALGEMQKVNNVLIFEPSINKSRQNIIENAEAMAERINSGNYQDANGNIIKVTADEIKNNNALLTQLSVQDALGHFILDSDTMTANAAEGNANGTLADLRNLQKNATPEQREWFNKTLGIDLNNVTEEDYYNKIKSFGDSGNAVKYNQNSKRIAQIKQSVTADTKYSTVKKGIKVKDGSIKWYKEDGKKLAVLREGDSYYVYNPANNSISTDGHTLEELNKSVGYKADTAKVEKKTAPVEEVKKADNKKVVDKKTTEKKETKTEAVSEDKTAKTAKAEVASESTSYVPKNDNATRDRVLSEFRALASEDSFYADVLKQLEGKSETEQRKLLTSLYHKAYNEHEQIVKDHIDKNKAYTAADDRRLADLGGQTSMLESLLLTYVTDSELAERTKAVEKVRKDREKSVAEYEKAKEKAKQRAKSKENVEKPTEKVEVSKEDASQSVSETKKTENITIKELSAEDMKKLSPMARKYVEIKKKNADAIVMVRLGDFYEMFFDDAKTAAELLDLTLTGRDVNLDRRAYMSGIPAKFFDDYVSKLNKAGKNVVVDNGEGEILTYAVGAEATAVAENTSSAEAASEETATQTEEKVKPVEKKTEKPKKNNFAKRIDLVKARTKLVDYVLKSEGVKTRPKMQGIFELDGKQCLCDGFFGVIFNNKIEGLKQAEDHGDPVRLDTIINNYKTTDKNKIVNINADALRETVPSKHSEYKSNIARLGNAYFQTAMLSRTIDALENPVCYVTGKESPLYIKADNGEAVVLPLRSPAKLDTVYEVDFANLSSEENEKIKTKIEQSDKKYKKEVEQRRKENEERRANIEKEDAEYLVNAKKELDESVATAENDFVGGKAVSNKEIKVYKDSRYDYREGSLLLELFERNNITIPLKTRGWIKNQVSSVKRTSEGKWYILYNKNASKSTVIGQYLESLYNKINNNVNTTTEAEDTATAADDTVKVTEEKTENVRKADKIEDFGEKIGGARKDLWSRRGLMVDDLSEMNYREAEKYVKKDNVWKRPDYKKLVSEGGSKALLYAQNEIRKSLNATISYGYKSSEETRKVQQSKYVETMREIQAMAEKATTKADFEAMGKPYLLQKGYIEEIPDAPTYGAKFKYTSAYYDNPALYKSGYYNTINWLAKHFDTLEDSAKRSEFGVEKANNGIPSGFDIHEGKSFAGYTGSGKWYVTKSTKIGNIIVATYDTYEQAKAGAIEFGAKKKKSKVRYVPEQLKDIHRVGLDYRVGKDATGDDFIKDFAIKGGEFGNWLSETDRRESLNYGYDALCDLADALNIDLSDISFKGKLNIAFGARGEGLTGASAHYEPARKVINLTKMRGAGALAHEWWHAFEDYISGDTHQSTMTSDFNSLPAKTKSAAKDLVAKMNYKDGVVTAEEQNSNRVKRLDRDKRIMDRLFSENFTIFSDDLTAEQRKERAEKYGYKRTPTDADIKKFNELKEKIYAGDINVYNENYVGNRTIVDEISDLKKEITGRGVDKDSRGQIAYYVTSIANDSVNVTEEQTKRVKTDFYNDAVAISQTYAKDGGYWDSNCEMLARAFAEYVAAKTGRKNDYLSGHSYVAVPIDDTKIAYICPHGEEAAIINKAFDELFNAAKEDGLISDTKRTKPTGTSSYALSEKTLSPETSFTKSQRLSSLQMKRAEGWAKENVKGYDSLSVADKLEVEWTIASGWENGVDETTIKSLAAISADSGVGIGFAKTVKVDKNGKEFSPDAVCYKNNDHVTIYLSPDSKRAVESATLHELTHMLEGAEGYEILKAEAEKYYSEHKDEKDAIIKAYRETSEAEEVQFLEETLPSELTAHYVEKMLTNRSVLAKLTVESPTTMQKCIKWLKQRVGLIKGVDAVAADDIQMLENRFVSTYNMNKGKIVKTETKSQYMEDKYVAIEIVSDRHKAVLNKTLYVANIQKKKSSNVGSANAITHTSETPIGVTSINSISKSSEKVNTTNKNNGGTSQNALDMSKKQDKTSAATSINKNKLPALYNKVEFKSGTINLDIGGGKFDNASEFLATKGVQNYIYDPYNRSKEHNNRVAKLTEEGKSDTVTISNVLNVIDSIEGRNQVLENAVDAVKPGGTVYITVYEGNGTGVAKVSGQDQFQLNRMTADYMDEVKKYFGDVTLKNKVIVAKKPIKSTGLSTVAEVKQYYDAKIDKAYSKYKEIDPYRLNFTKEHQDAFVEWNDTYTKLEAEKQKAIRQIKNKRASIDSEGRQLTSAQKAFFKGTKIVNDKGNLQVVYHGTDSMFEEFSYKRIGVNGTSEGKGFYFTDVKGYADGYRKDSGRLIEAYLDIKKPLNSKKLTISEANFRRFVKKVSTMAEDGYALSNYADIDDEGVGKAINEAVRMEYEYNENDVDIIHSLYNALSDVSLEDYYSALKKTLGYDGIIEPFENGNFYIAFEPEQVKHVSNEKPTSSRDMRYALPIASIKGSDKVLTEMPDKTATVKDVMSGDVSVKELREQSRAKTSELAEHLQIILTNSQAGIEKVFKQSGRTDGAQLTNYVRAAKYSAMNMLDREGGQYTLDGTQKVGESWGRIWDKIYSRDRKEKGYYQSFMTYLYHWHNTDRMADSVMKSVLGEDVTPDISRAEIAKMDEVYPEFKRTAEKVWKYLDNNLQMRVDAGLITEEHAENLRSMYPHYVPTYRAEDGGIGGIAPLQGRSNVKIKKTIKAATGSEKALLPIDEVVAQQTMQLVPTARLNSLVNEMTNANSDSVVITKREAVGTPNRDAVIGTDKLTNSVTFYQNGEQVTAQVTNNVFKGIEAYSPSGESSYNNAVLRMAMKANTTFKKLVTSWNPFFSFFRNPIRDIQEAGLYTRYPLRTFAKNYGRARKEISSNGKYWQEAKAAGITSASVYSYETGLTQKSEGRFAQMTQRIDEASNAIEMAPRMAEYISAREAGKSVQQALLEAQDVTVNFGRSGTFTKMLNATIMPFLNPSIQGMSKMVRAFTGKDAAQSFVNLIVRSIMLGIGLTALNDMLNDDDEDYAALSDYVKENNYCIAIGDGNFIKIPKGRVLSVIASAYTRSKKMIQGDEDAWDGYLETFMSQVTPVDNISRTIFSPFKDIATNTTWYGGTIESQKYENVEAKNRYDENTSSIAIKLGQMFNYSPTKIHYLLDQYGGIITDVLLPATTVAAEEGIVSKNFFTNSATNSKWSTEFYDTLEKQNYKKSAGDDVAYYVVRYMNSTKTTVNQLYTQKRAIQSDTSLSNDEKLTQIKVIQTSINALQKDALENVDFLSTELKKYDLANDANAYYDALSIVCGSDYALRAYNKDVYNRAANLTSAGISYDTYYDYYFGTKDIDSDKDKNGETISGSKKAKVVAFINAMNISTEQKQILLMSNGYTVDTNTKKTVATYISKLKITSDEKVALAKVCGFTVNGTKIVLK